MQKFRDQETEVQSNLEINYQKRKKKLTLVLHLELESGKNACSFKMRSLTSSSVNLETLALLFDIIQATNSHTLCSSYSSTVTVKVE